jgi:hypothetical protein
MTRGLANICQTCCSNVRKWPIAPYQALQHIVCNHVVSRHCADDERMTLMTLMYGPAVRCKRSWSIWRWTVLHQCIRPLIGAHCAPGHHGYQRACDLISGQASMGHFGHQGSHAPGRTNLHVVLSSRRPRQVMVSNYIIACSLISRWTIKQVGRWRSTSPQSSGHEPEHSRRCGPACWRAQSRARCGAAASWPPRSRA